MITKPTHLSSRRVVEVRKRHYRYPSGSTLGCKSKGPGFDPYWSKPSAALDFDLSLTTKGLNPVLIPSRSGLYNFNISRIFSGPVKILPKLVGYTWACIGQRFHHAPKVHVISLLCCFHVYQALAYAKVVLKSFIPLPIHKPKCILAAYVGQLFDSATLHLICCGSSYMCIRHVPLRKCH